MYDRSIRVPLIIYDPRVEEHRDIDDMALNIDVTATIVDLAEIDVPASYHGKSLVPIVSGDTSSLSRDAVLIEHLWEFPDIPSSEGVRTDDWKYLRYLDDPSIEELYNLRVDPEETNDLASDPDHQETLEGLRAKLSLLTERYDVTSSELSTQGNGRTGRSMNCPSGPDSSYSEPGITTGTSSDRLNHNILTALGSNLRASIVKINATPAKT